MCGFNSHRPLQSECLIGLENPIGTLFCLGRISSANEKINFCKQTVKFQLSVKGLIRLDAHHRQIALSVFRDENRLAFNRREKVALFSPF